MGQFSVEPEAEAAYITWQPADNNFCPITGYLISYQFIRLLQCPEESTDVEEMMQKEVSPSVTQYNITGLRPDAIYIVGVQAQSDSGLSQSKNISIQTLESSKSTQTLKSTTWMV